MLRTFVVVVFPVLLAIFFYRRKSYLETSRLQLAQLLCVTNNLPPLYQKLQANELPAEALQSLVDRCRNVPVTEQTLSTLTSDGSFLSSFFVKTCDSFHESPAAKQSSGFVTSSAVQVLESGISFPRDGPAILKLTDEQREKLLPRWLWDASVVPSVDELLKSEVIKGYKIEAQPGALLKPEQHAWKTNFRGFRC